MKTVILISGKKGYGKDTLCSFIQKNSRQSFVRVAYADTLKEMTALFVQQILQLDVPKEVFFDAKLKEEPITIPFVEKQITPRYLLQVFGTEFIRDKFDTNYWVKVAWNKIISKYPSDNIIITDCRFPNEIKIFKQFASQTNEYKVITVRINKSSVKTKAKKFFAPKEHPSETALDSYKKFDFTYNNISSLEDLEKFACELIQKL